MDSTPNEVPSAAPGGTRNLVARNTLYLTLSQVVTVPLAVLVNALTARYLGAEAFGYIYLAGTFAGFGILAVNWGHEGALPAMVARDHSIAGTALGSSLAWRACLSIVVYSCLAALCSLLGYNIELQWVLALTFLATVIGSMVAACKDTIQGFERTDISAYTHVGQQLLGACLITPVLLLGGGVRSVLLIGNVTGVIVLVLILRTLRSVGVGRLSIKPALVKALFVGGTPFLFFGLAMALQPNIDAIYMSKLGSVHAVGWYAVARRLIGLLLFPASALTTALYPTLCRLWIDDQEEFRRVARGGLHSVTLLVMPIALGCGLYPDLGIAIFSKENFGPAADDLRVLALFLFVVYFTMPIGVCVLASGKQRVWSVVQSLCIVVSLVLDPLLIPVFQRRYENGGLGPCVASVVSELVVAICGLILMPRGVFDARMRRALFFAVLAGLAMSLCAILLRSITPWVAAPIAVAAYAGVLRLSGEIDQALVDKLKGVVMGKLSRFRRG
jgi:O-antigen/teichoic acid export membrane protein